MALIKNSIASDVARNAIVFDLADVRRQGEILIEQAKKRAEAIIAEAKTEREKILAGAKESGRAEGHAKGLEEGRKLGIQQGADAALKENRANLDVVQKSWTTELASFQAMRDGLQLDAGTSVLRLAFAISEKVIKRAVAADPSVVVDQLKAAIELVIYPSRLRVNVNPEDRPTLESALPQLTSQFRNAQHIDLIDDPAVSRGSCRAVAKRTLDADADSGLDINATLESQLDRIATALLPGKDAV